MKASQFFISTLKEAPADAEIVSHKLMMRAGMIKKLGAGIYSYMPMGLRVIRKVEAIIREEMNRAGAVELLMPVVQPAELWQETGRFDKMGPELLRVKDRHGRDFVIQPTSEEVITDIARQELRSYKQLPKNFYHIQTKFRDERRPRFGVMRGREFTMKDAYSFDRDRGRPPRQLPGHGRRLLRIFDRMGLTYRAVAADTGAIGGDGSQEFQVIADTGEDAIVYCPAATTPPTSSWPRPGALPGARGAARADGQGTPTPGKSTCADVAALLGLPLQRTVKSLVLATDDRNEAGEIVKTRSGCCSCAATTTSTRSRPARCRAQGGLPLCHQGEIVDALRLQARLPGADRVEEAGQGRRRPRTVAAMADFVCGANGGLPLTGVNWGRDLPEPELVADMRNVVEGDPRPTARACWPSSAASRWAMCSTSAPSTARDERHLLDETASRNHRDGLLRHRRHAPAGRGDRAEP
jgi:prolyl-tRNA synthetase